MKPARIKMYYCLPMTRRQYVIVQGLFLLAWFVLLVVSLTFGVPQPAGPMHPLPAWVVTHVPWILVGVIVVESLEAVVVLRRFTRLEQSAEGKEQAAGG